MEDNHAQWMLLNKHHLYMLLLAIRHYKKWREEQPIADQFMGYLIEAETKIRDAVHLAREEELRTKDKEDYFSEEDIRFLIEVNEKL